VEKAEAEVEVEAEAATLPCPVRSSGAGVSVSGAWTAADFGTRLGDGDTVGVVAFAGVDAAAGLAGEAVRLTRVSVS
jgi:hypothetical protein